MVGGNFTGGAANRACRVLYRAFVTRKYGGGMVKSAANDLCGRVGQDLLDDGATPLFGVYAPTVWIFARYLVPLGRGFEVVFSHHSC